MTDRGLTVRVLGEIPPSYFKTDTVTFLAS